eukprot:CAMPEP_0180306038 /NCGR_PEP_ID=MMETSP0988-20121125/26781_1 /TAXON_ID=697907 /ORGANISM="non described non described, Strain CCMP2293" /LENGTH=99 /DNA_ID=CAMNT_0022288581 /DNA_START=780 /DNA_END=1079 /DNA_ORIENTATION=+
MGRMARTQSATSSSRRSREHGRGEYASGQTRRGAAENVPPGGGTVMCLLVEAQSSWWRHSHCASWWRHSHDPGMRAKWMLRVCQDTLLVWGSCFHPSIP